MSISSNYPLLRPSLLLDFAQVGRLDPRVQFTRASSATFFDQLGVLQTAAAGEARFDYDPATLAAQGLLIEEQRTNSIRNNTMQGAVAGTPGTNPTNWSVAASGSGITREIVGTGTEDGITYIDIKFSGTGSGGATPQITPETTTDIVAAAGQAWTASYYLRIVDGSTTGVSGFSQVWVERDAAGAGLNTDVVSISTPTTAALKTQRNILTRTLTDAGTARLTNRIQFICTNGVAVDITLRIGLPQLEQGAFATSVIPTTSASATRNADVATMTGTNFSSWFNNAEGTLYAEFSLITGGSGAAGPVGIGDPTKTFATSDSLYVSYSRTTTAVSFTVLDDGATQAAISAGNLSVSIGKIASAYKVNDFASSLNGLSAVTDTSGTIPSPTVMTIGSHRSISLASTSDLNGTIRRIAFYPTRLPNAQLVALTG
jgi:hypothetical protein